MVVLAVVPKKARLTTRGLHGSPQLNKELGTASSLLQFCITHHAYAHVHKHTKRPSHRQENLLAHAEKELHITPQIPLSHSLTHTHFNFPTRPSTAGSVSLYGHIL